MYSCVYIYIHKMHVYYIYIYIYIYIYYQYVNICIYLYIYTYLMNTWYVCKSQIGSGMRGSAAPGDVEVWGRMWWATVALLEILCAPSVPDFFPRLKTRISVAPRKRSLEKKYRCEMFASRYRRLARAPKRHSDKNHMKRSSAQKSLFLLKK